MHWYVVHAYSGFEKKVMRALKDRIARTFMEIFSAKSWCRPKKWWRCGRPETPQRAQVLPGYVLVQMETHTTDIVDASTTRPGT